MKKLVILFIISAFVMGASITTNKLKIGKKVNQDITIEFDIGNGSLNPFVRWNQTDIVFTNDGVNINSLGTGGGSGESGINLVKNPGCENGAATPDDWTASGGALVRTEIAGEVIFGNASCEWDASASGQTLTAATNPLPNGLNGQNCLTRIDYTADTIASGDYTLRAKIVGGGDLTTKLDLPPTSVGIKRPALLAFPCPVDQDIEYVLESEVADPDKITIDRTHIGSNTSEVLLSEQPVTVANIYYATTASCEPALTNTSMTILPDGGASCPAPTVLLHLIPGAHL